MFFPSLFFLFLLLFVGLSACFLVRERVCRVGCSGGWGAGGGSERVGEGNSGSQYVV